MFATTGKGVLKVVLLLAAVHSLRVRAFPQQDKPWADMCEPNTLGSSSGSCGQRGAACGSDEDCSGGTVSCIECNCRGCCSQAF